MPSGEVVTGFGPNDVQIRNPYTGEIRLNLTGHSNHLYPFVYLPKSDILASGSYDRTIKLWNWRTGELIKSWISYNDFVLKLIVLPNGDLVSAGGWYDPTIKVWSAANNFELSRIIQLQKNASPGLVLLKNGYLAIGDSVPGNLFIVNPNNDSIVKKIENAHTVEYWTMIELENGDIATSGYENSVKIWSGSDYSLKRVVTSNTACHELASLPNNHLACGSGNDIYIWNLNNGDLVKNLTGHTSRVFGLVMLKNGELASSSESIKLWGAASK